MIQLKIQIKNNLINWNKSRLKNDDFTIISNNCWGGEVYRSLGLRYKTPFVGLFLFPPCYLKLLENIQEYLKQELVFVSTSRYEAANQNRKQGIWGFYPIGLLEDEIEIHFMHYSSPTEAIEKWNRRLNRINWDNLFFKFCDRNLLNSQLIEDFDQLSLPHKVCFTSQHYPTLNSTVWIQECQHQPGVVDGGSLYRICHKYFDVIDWLNGGSGKLNLIQKKIPRFLP